MLENKERAAGAIFFLLRPFALLSVILAAFCFSAAFPLPACCFLLSFRAERDLVILLIIASEEEFFLARTCSCICSFLLVFWHVLSFDFLSFQGFVSGTEGKLSWTVLTVMIIANTSLAQSNPKLLLPNQHRQQS